MSWDRPFDQPVPLPKGAPARTLRDAANYIRRLPKSKRDRLEWRLAFHLLIEAAEDRAPMMFARMGILRASERARPNRALFPSSDRSSPQDVVSWPATDDEHPVTKPAGVNRR
jgi:hypothetical protein